VLSCVVAATAQAQVRTSGGMTTLALPSQTSQLARISHSPAVCRV
jgi:hypothetical protein